MAVLMYPNAIVCFLLAQSNKQILLFVCENLSGFRYNGMNQFKYSSRCDLNISPSLLYYLEIK